MRVTPADRAIAAIAARQHQVWNRDQAFRAGATSRLMGDRLQAGDWVEHDSKVYGYPGQPLTWLRSLKVAELCARDAAIAVRAAAALHELDGFRPCRPEIVVPLTTRTRSRIARIHRYAGAKVVTVKGFRVTSIAQTCFDLAPHVSPWALERAMDGALVAKRLAVSELEERLAFYRGARRHGLVLVRALVEERGADAFVPPESELERVATRVLAQACGGWVRQFAAPFRSPAGSRVDFALPAERLIVEVDGRRWHTRMEDFDRDRWRDNEAIAAGWRVLRFTWVHLTATPDACIDVIRRTLGRAA